MVGGGGIAGHVLQSDRVAVGKIRVLLSCLLILMVSSTSAQVFKGYGLKIGAIHAEQRWEYSPRSGLSASGISPIWGLEAGISAEFFRFPNFSVMTELHYAQRGRSITAMATAPADNPQGYVDLGPVEVKHRFIYLGVPFLAKLRIDGGKVSPYVAFGPRIEYLAFYPSSPVYDSFRKTELSAYVLAGFELSLESIPTLTAEIGYETSLTNAFRNELVTVKNRSFSYLVGITF
jgi:hypothetical protein